MKSKFLTVLLFTIATTQSMAHDNGQYENVDPEIRSWFKSIKSPSGVPCCDIADGHYTQWRKSETSGFEYEVLIDKKWMPVPPEAVIRYHTNPTGSSVVWYSKFGDTYYIRCFIQESGT